MEWSSRHTSWPNIQSLSKLNVRRRTDQVWVQLHMLTHTLSWLPDHVSIDYIMNGWVYSIDAAPVHICRTYFIQNKDYLMAWWVFWRVRFGIFSTQVWRSLVLHIYMYSRSIQSIHLHNREAAVSTIALGRDNRYSISLPHFLMKRSSRHTSWRNIQSISRLNERRRTNNVWVELHMPTHILLWLLDHVSTKYMMTGWV